MKRIFSVFLTLMLWFSIVPLSNHYPTIVFATREGNRPASFIAVRLLPVGYDRDGSEIDPGVRVDPNDPDSGPRYFPWEFRRGSAWGRSEVPMMTRPVYWFEFYLTVQADGGRSRPEHRWVGVIDSHGQLWLDPDGHFHDSTYDRFADPNDPAYEPGACEYNPRAQRDPASNTQGPYILDPNDPHFKQEIYFYDKLGTGRGFRIGWVDMVDYPAADSLPLPCGTQPDGIVREGDWDVGMPLERFANLNVTNDDGEVIATQGQEWHTEHVRENGYFDLGEAIYRLGPGRIGLPEEPEYTNIVLEGDYRLTHVSLTDGMESYTYYLGTYVQEGDLDIGMPIVPFQDDASPVVQAGEEWHSIIGMPNGQYDPGEAIYLKLHGIPEPVVQVGDQRRTNVNTRSDREAIAGGIYKGDVMIFSEVLSADGGNNRYDISVQTDVWLGGSPSVTTARLFSPNGDIPAQAQRIQKSTVLDPDGRTFTVPATTFHDISIRYRSYIGVQIFADNGQDANLGAALPADKLFAQNASDDYRTGRTGEEFLGAVNGNYAFDFGRPLMNFQGNEFFFDLRETYVDELGNPVEPVLGVEDPDLSYFNDLDFGCQTPVYRKLRLTPDYNPTTVEIGGDEYYIKYVVEAGDIRMTPVTLERGGQRVHYPANSVVAPGDLDVDENYWLKPIPANIRYFNRNAHADIIEYEHGDPIYRANQGMVDENSVRLTEIEFGGMTYNCNTQVGEYDFWVRETPARMITMGLSGDSRCFDMTVLPGLLDIDIQIDRPMKVEQTTQISARVNTPLEKDDKVYVTIKEPVVPSFSGQRREAFYSSPIMVPHQWHPIVPEGEDPRDYLIAPYPYDPRIRDTFGNVWGEFNVLTQHLPWSNPRAYGRDQEWATQNFPAWNNWDTFTWIDHDDPRSDDSPAAAPRRGPYPWTIPSPRGGGDRFEFPFDGERYRQLWVAPFPALSLFNGAPNRPWYVDNDPTMNTSYMLYNVMTNVYTNFPNYGNTPALVAYGEFHFNLIYLHYAYLFSQTSPQMLNYYRAFHDYFERAQMTISPARFTKVGNQYFPNSQTTGWASQPGWSPATAGLLHYRNPDWYKADHFGVYDRDLQMPGNGVYGYLDETSTPRRVILTWRVNHSYDHRYSHASGNFFANTPATAYQPYNVQIVLYENGTFQYNYSGGNQWWTQYTTWTPSNCPVVGWYGGRRDLRQLAQIPGVFNWHNNKDLGNAPSVRWTYTELAGIDQTDEKRIFVDYRELDRENPEVTWQYTPYRGTCNEDGTRTRLEISAFLNRGGYTDPVPLTPLANVPFDVINPPVGAIEREGGYNIYVDMDGRRITSPGDIRLTEGIWGGQTYAVGSIVREGDADNNLIMMEYDIPLGGAIYDGSGVPEEKGKILVYLDINRNGIADEGDVRLVAFESYEHGSIVGPRDWETMIGWQARELVLFPARAPLGVMNDNDGNPRYVYWDRDASQTLTPYDIRLVAVESYQHGSIVRTGDIDINTPFEILDAQLGVVNPMAHVGEWQESYPDAMRNQSANHSANVYVNMGTRPMVEPGDIRLSTAYIMDGTQIIGTYPAGTIVRTGDLDDNMSFEQDYLDAQVIEHFSAYGSGIYLDLDGDGVPSSGDIRLTRNTFTSRGNQTFNMGYVTYPPYTYHRMLGQFPPGSIVQHRPPITWQSPWDPDWYYNQPGFQRPYAITADNVHHWPGQSAWYNPRYLLDSGNVPSAFVNVNEPPTISVTANNRVYLNRGSAHSSVRVNDIRLTEIGILHQGTPVEIDSPDRQSHFMFDPYWARHPWTKLELDENPFKALHPRPQAGPDPLIPDHVYDGYDLYAWERYDIAPEDLIIETDRECLNLHEQRFPNIGFRLINADNPHDVNDPANMVVSGDPQERLIMNFNAHGGGIKFMFTAIGQPPAYQKYIGQYNMDDTVVFWYWYDNAPYGVLDPNDFLMTNPDHVKSSPFKPVGGNPTQPVSRQDPPFPARIWDIDCSFGQSVCTIPGDRPGFPRLGEVNNRNFEFAYKTGDLEGLTIWDHGDHIINQNGTAPSFDGITPDPQVNRWRQRGDRTGNNFIAARAYGTVFTYGIPIEVTPFTDRDDGGRGVAPVFPTRTDTPVTIRVYSARAIYDYNSRYPMGPAFINDMAPGIDYVGVKDLPVLDPDPKVNFGEFNVVDHALQNSKVNYTSGGGALSPMDFPTPRISADYDPILRNLKEDMRAYPGGQTHTGRIPGNELHSGFNAYPAIWRDMYNKLGTEMMPFTDYGIYFILHDGMDRRLFWNPNITQPDQNIRSITVEGPFMMPRVFEGLGGVGQLTRALKSNYPDHLPVQYDFSGRLVIDLTNYQLYSSTAPPDFTDLASPNSVDAFRYRHINERLMENKDLWYQGLNPSESPVAQWMTSNEGSGFRHTIHFIDEIIPIGPGKLSITVELYDGTIRKFEECCEEIYDDIPVHGLEVNTNMDTIEVDNPTHLEVQLKEYHTKGYPEDQHVVPCNDALVFLWQDRGIKDAQGAIHGAGDGWITVPPRSSEATGEGTQISRFYDLNGDGKISFNDWETEIIGTYDLATNTWSAGVIDARTYNRNNGMYHFDLTATNGSLVDTVGMDFGGPLTVNNLPDRVIDDFELLPVYVTAYKFGDDNNDRAFTPLYSLTRPYEFSHEVYLAGLKHLPVVPRNDLIVSYAPEPLTAGCVPELLENEQPLTFTVLDDEGQPVDLRVGITDRFGNNEVGEEEIWNVLFKDPHPCNKTFYGPDATLPQYYWVRTDLHNDDGTLVNNYRMYSFPRNPFQPIEIDFSRASEGVYEFYGFNANDEGSFQVFVDTPDRRRRGVVDVKVQLPQAQYAIGSTFIDWGADGLRSYSVGRDTDFVMTCANISEYHIITLLRDAQGNPIRGLSSEICDMGENLTRFTPYITKPDNFNHLPINQRFTSNIMRRHRTREDSYYNLRFGFDGNTLRYLYNTTNWQWDNGEWELTRVLDLPPAGNLRGWGYGSIYNSPHKGGYLFARFEGSGISHESSYEIADEGFVHNIVGFNDIGYFGALVGKNPYSNSDLFGDVGGGIAAFRGINTNPGDIRYRFNTYRSDTQAWSNRDGIFSLDWDAFVDHNAEIARPVARVFDASTNRELSKDLIDPNNYDLIYGKTNHLVIQISPASENDLGIIPQGTVLVSDDEFFPDDNAFETKSEAFAYALTELDDDQFGIGSSAYGNLRVTPTGSWRDISQLKYFGFRSRFRGDFYRTIRDPHARVWSLAHFDVVRALQVKAETSKQLAEGETATMMVYAMELGTQKAVANANVRISGAGVTMDARTDSSGAARFTVHPTSSGVIAIRVNHPQLGDGYTEVHVMGAPEPNEILLEVSASHKLTNEPEVAITGRTNAGNTVQINDQPVDVQEDGQFESRVRLQEGSNQIVVTSSDRLGRTARKMLTVVKRTQGPSIFVDEVPDLVDIREYELKGKVTPGATLKANGHLANVQGENWTVTIPLDFGRNVVRIEAVDEIGNISTKEIEIMVYHQVEVRLAIGSRSVTVNGIVAEDELDVAPYIKQGSTFVPLRVLSEALGAKVEWLADVRGIVIELMDNKIEMQIGSSRAIVNGRTTEMAIPPEITQGVTFVPLRFVADVLGAETEWIAETREIVVTLLTY